jgi:hypothetical protein
VVAQKAKGLRAKFTMPPFKPSDAKFGYDFGDITLPPDAFALLNENWVVVNALPWQNAPIVKAFWVRLQMPLAEKRRFVASTPKQLGEGLKFRVKAG